MIAVLPFENLTGDPAQEFVSEGLTEEMITRLAMLNHEQLGVIARTSAMTYKGTGKPVDQIGRELGVSFILEGSVRRAGERVRITTQLIRVSDETHLWAEGYERNLHDILSVQAEVARAVARDIQVKLPVRAERRLERTAAIDPESGLLFIPDFSGSARRTARWRMCVCTTGTGRAWIRIFGAPLSCIRHCRSSITGMENSSCPWVAPRTRSR